MFLVPSCICSDQPQQKKKYLILDGSAQGNGVSLIDTLMKIPDLLVSLPRLMLRFRKRHVAVTKDIREMFHQIKVFSYICRIYHICNASDDFWHSFSHLLANFRRKKNSERFAKNIQMLIF